MSIEPTSQKLSLSMAVARDAPLPSHKDYIISDTKTRWLCLRVQAGGSKTWILRRKLGSRPIKFMLGAFPEMSYVEAAKSCLTAAALIQEGKDPNQAKRQQVRETEQTRREESFTMIQCFDEYVTDKTNSGNPPKPRTILDWKKTRDRLEKNSLKSVSLTDLTGAMLADFYDHAARKSKSSRATNGGRTQAALDLRYLRAA